ncbi:ribonuclease H2 subunit C [Varanus komodoensis]|uniref:ribonuclease H2 subunit C n=1 Tax=Varanus komodoensis TaxID=61221 RepID=UPI001CF7DAA2|nr:ribonuclease H2 subunit C [Varanus komodoensis]
MAGEDRGAVRLVLPSPPGAPRERPHLLPCAVHHDGAAAVRRYFAPAIRPADAPGAELSVSFRGRSLKGKEVQLPEGYVGLVLKEDASALSPLEERQVRVKSSFDAVTVWNLERAPDSMDEILMAFDWPKIAEGRLWMCWSWLKAWETLIKSVRFYWVPVYNNTLKTMSKLSCVVLSYPPPRHKTARMGGLPEI